MLIVVNLYKEKVPVSQSVYIGRGNPLGNPFTHQSKDKTRAQYQVETREQAILAYEGWLKDKIEQGEGIVLAALKAILKREIKDKTTYLVCCCKPKDCHGDVIVRILQDKYYSNKVLSYKNP